MSSSPVSVIADPTGPAVKPSPTEPACPAMAGCRVDLAPGGSPRQDSDAAFSTAGFLAYGSSAFGHLPGFPVVSRPSACRLQLRGQPRIGAWSPSPCSLLIPSRGTVRGLIRAAIERRQRESSRSWAYPRSPMAWIAAIAPAMVTRIPAIVSPLTWDGWPWVVRPEILIAITQATVPTPICTSSMPPT